MSSTCGTHSLTLRRTEPIHSGNAWGDGAGRTLLLMLERLRDIERLTATLRLLLMPKDPNEGKNVIVEIRGAEGGEEANLFARDLFEMYQGYSGRMGWRLEVLGSDPSDMGGFNDITFLLKGDG